MNFYTGDTPLGHKSAQKGVSDRNLVMFLIMKLARATRVLGRCAGELMGSDKAPRHENRGVRVIWFFSARCAQRSGE